MSLNNNHEVEDQIIDNYVYFNYKRNEYQIKSLIEYSICEHIIYGNKLTWSNSQQSRFIESVLLGIPVNNIYVQRIDLNVRVIDGSQRLQSLFNYAKNQLELSSLNTLTSLNGHDYNYLTKDCKQTFLRTIVEWSEVDECVSWDRRYKLYKMLNNR